MRLNAPSRFTSFYESFTDLIFATMAIFVLLLIIVLTQVEDASEAEAEPQPQRQAMDASEALEKQKELERELRKSRADLAESRRKRQQSEEELKKALEKLDESMQAIQSRAVDLVVAVDVSGTMTEELSHLKEVMLTVVRTFPHALPDLRIGIVAFPRATDAPETMHEIELRSVDPGATGSNDALDEFIRELSNLQIVGGAAFSDIAISTGLAWLRESPKAATNQQVILLLGDICPMETEDLTVVEPAELRRMENIYREVGGYSKQNPRFSLVCLYSPHHDYPPQILDPSRRYFQQLAAEAGGADKYTEDVSAMFEMIFKEALSQ